MRGPGDGGGDGGGGLSVGEEARESMGLREGVGREERGHWRPPISPGRAQGGAARPRHAVLRGRWCPEAYPHGVKREARSLGSA